MDKSWARRSWRSGEQIIQGLSSEEVELRRAQGQVNRAVSSTSRPISSILRSNIFTLFNAILVGAMLLLLAVGQVRDAILTGGLVAFSVGVSTFQEIRAKRRLDRIALLARVPVKVIRDGQEHNVDPTDLVLGDYVKLSRGDPVVADGTLVAVDGLEVNEALLTGESEPSVKSKGDRVLSGSFCVAGSGVYVAEQVGESSYAQRLATAARAFRNPRTPTQELIDQVLRALLVVVAMLSVLQAVVSVYQGVSVVDAIRATAVIATLVPQGLLLMSTVTYSVGAVRIAQVGALVQQLNAVESLSHVNVLCLDKTGTLTTNRLRLSAIVPLNAEKRTAEEMVGAFAASFPEPSSMLSAIVSGHPSPPLPVVSMVPFSSERRWSALTFAPPCRFGTLVLGAPEALMPHLATSTGLMDKTAAFARSGQRVLLLARVPEPASALSGQAAKSFTQLPNDLVAQALIALEEEIRPEAGVTLAEFAGEGVGIKIISGDNPATALAIAKRVGLPPDIEAMSGAQLAALPPAEFAEALQNTTVFGRVSPEEKREMIRTLKEKGYYVAMIGDGVNDVLALKQANVGVAMRSGSAAARAVADVVLLNDSFDLLPRAVVEGRRIINSLTLLIKLFLIRDVATIELILASGLLGAPFPLLPPHAALIGFLTVGVPALLIVAWASPNVPRRQSLGQIAALVLQIGTAGALAIMSVYLLSLIGFEADVAQARTAVVTAALLSGLITLTLLWYPVYAPLSVLFSDRRVIALAATLLVVYLLVLYSPTAQRLLEIRPLSLLDWVVILPVVLLWFAILRLVVRHRVPRRLVP